jgi:two-component system sensor histidine kinase QseC
VSTGKHVTLSHRLLIALGVVSFLFWTVMTALTTRENIAEVNELYDVHLAHTAKAFLHLMDPDDDEKETLPSTMSSAAIGQLFEVWPDLPARPSINKPTAVAASSATATYRPLESKRTQYGLSLRYQLWRDDTGNLLFRSDNAPTTPMTGKMGFSDTVDAQNQGWRHYQVRDKHHNVRVIVSEPHEFRNQLVRSMILSAATPLALGLPVLFLLLWFSIKRGLLPLAKLSQEITKRQADNLTPINVQSVPGEVQPIVTALNDLLRRMAQTLENERQFTDDAAHQLRTPLAAIQAQLYAARHAPAEAIHERALDQLQLSVARGIRLVNQLLALARLDPRQAKPDLAPVNLSQMAETVCAELAVLALQKDQTLELQAAPELPRINGHADMLAMLLSNLVDNAIHYTPRGGLIHITLEAEDDGVALSVSDNGPGIAPDQRARVFERFYRIAEQSQPGTGLGLAICQRIAELHHASLTLSEGPAGRGLTVRIHFKA